MDAACRVPLYRLSHQVPSFVNTGNEISTKGLPSPPRGSVDIDLSGLSVVTLKEPRKHPQLRDTVQS